MTKCWYFRGGERREEKREGTDREGVGQCLLRGIGALEEGRGGKRREEKGTME